MIFNLIGIKSFCDGFSNLIVMKVCEIKVSYSNLNTQKVKIKESKDVFTLALNHWDINTIETQEEVKVLLLNRRI